MGELSSNLTLFAFRLGMDPHWSAAPAEPAPPPWVPFPSPPPFPCGDGDGGEGETTLSKEGEPLGADV